MSRNLCRSRCARCDSLVALLEHPRLITKDEAGRYFEEYCRMYFAAAECTVCGAEYLAWAFGEHCGSYMKPAGGGTHFDLSFRSTFNDEPGAGDLPAWGGNIVYPEVDVRESDAEDCYGTYWVATADGYTATGDTPRQAVMALYDRRDLDLWKFRRSGLA